jgi:hypothetical protein
MKKIVAGIEVLFDGEDLPILNDGLGWTITAHGVKVSFPRIEKYKNNVKSMHRVIMKPGPGMVVDHINGNVYDNRKSNLRICTRSENMWNRGPAKVGKVETHGFKGVIKASPGKPKQWTAKLLCNGKKYLSKYFKTPKEAALAYDKMARDHHGKFAKLNFPEIEGD